MIGKTKASKKTYIFQSHTKISCYLYSEIKEKPTISTRDSENMVATKMKVSTDHFELNYLDEFSGSNEDFLLFQKANTNIILMM